MIERIGIEKEMNIRRIKDSLSKKYQKMASDYGKHRAAVMGCSYIMYKIFLMPVIRLMKKTIHTPKKNRIIMETKPDYADNGRVLSEYMVENGYTDKYQIIWLVENPKQFRKYETKNVKFVRSIGKHHIQRTVRAYYYALTSKYVLFTHVFRWVEKKLPDQLYVNLWHGCGYKASRRVPGKENIFDYCLVPGKVFIDTKAEFFGCRKDQVLPIGYPRYNLYRKDNPAVEEYFASLSSDSPQKKPRKNILWMPTFVQSKDLIHYDNPIPAIIGLPLMNSVLDLDRLEKICEEADVNLIIKRHRIGRTPQMDKGQKKEQHVFYLDDDILASKGIQLYEMIAKTDALITDFSSVAIDYILVDKPIGFTLDGLEDYAKTRGFAFEDPRKYMPGEHIYNLDDLAVFLKNVTEGVDLGKEQRRQIINETHNRTDDYCKRILDRFEIVK